MAVLRWQAGRPRNVRSCVDLQYRNSTKGQRPGETDLILVFILDHPGSFHPPHRINHLEDMPAITSGKVLVTGANGFIAGWITKHLLENGFSVRGTVRSAQKAEALQALFSDHASHLELTIVQDITAVSVRFVSCGHTYTYSPCPPLSRRMARSTKPSRA